MLLFLSSKIGCHDVSCKLAMGLSRTLKSHCLRKPGRAKRWGSADFKDILVMQSLSHMNANSRGLRNFKSFLSENDHPPSFLTLMRPQTILIKVNF